MNTASSYEIDTNQFQRLIKSGLAHDKDGNTLQAMEDLSDGIQIYQGVFLPDAIYEDWSREERERLKNIFLHGAEALANLYYKTSQYSLAVQVAERLLSEEPTLEEGYQLLMTALAQLGKRSRAIQIYKKCCEVLDNELGVEPTQKTKQIFEQIKNATDL